LASSSLTFSLCIYSGENALRISVTVDARSVLPLAAFFFVLLASVVAYALPMFEMSQVIQLHLFLVLRFEPSRQNFRLRCSSLSLSTVLGLYGGVFSKVSFMPIGARWLNSIDPVTLHDPCPSPFFTSTAKVEYGRLPDYSLANSCWYDNS